MGYEHPPNLLSRLRRSLWAGGGARAALAALVILASALGVMRLVVNAPPLPAHIPKVPAVQADSADTAGKSAEDSAAENAALEGMKPGMNPNGKQAGSRGAGSGIKGERGEKMDDTGLEPVTPTMSR